MAARYAQHFLINRHAAERIVASMNLEPNQKVLEIGPGKGALTELILRTGADLTVIEIDAPLVSLLKKKFSGASKLHIIHSDVLEVDFYNLAAAKIIGNLPYNLTSPILRKISDAPGWIEAYFMVQKEVGDRLAAEVGSTDYGALTVGMNIIASIEHVFDLSETSFKPAPRVKSSVIRLVRREKPLTDNLPKTHRVIQAAFQQRRKTILNSLSHGLNISKEQVSAALNQLELDPKARAENITIDQFVLLSQAL